MALIWLRLGSVDVGLAEAALGTGLLSALLVWLATRAAYGPGPDTKDPGARPWLRVGLGVLAGAVVGGAQLARAVRNRTTGVLHPLDVQPLFDVLGRLLDRGGTVVVVEHDPDIIATGAADQVAADRASVTGWHLARHLGFGGQVGVTSTVSRGRGVPGRGAISTRP